MHLFVWFTAAAESDTEYACRKPTDSSSVSLPPPPFLPPIAPAPACLFSYSSSPWRELCCCCGSLLIVVSSSVYVLRNREAMRCVTNEPPKEMSVTSSSLCSTPCHVFHRRVRPSPLPPVYTSDRKGFRSAQLTDLRSRTITAQGFYRTPDKRRSSNGHRRGLPACDDTQWCDVDDKAQRIHIGQVQSKYRYLRRLSHGAP